MEGSKGLEGLVRIGRSDSIGRIAGMVGIGRIGKIIRID